MNKILPLLLLFFIFVPTVSATGVGVNPAELNFDFGDRSSVLYVINTGEVESEYMVYVDEGYTDLIRIETDHFSLIPGSYKAVNISVFPLIIPREEDLYVFVVSSPSSQNLGVSSGIKVPLHIESPISISFISISVAVVSVLVITYVIYKRTRKR
ncbi:MAG: hypothetical protein SVM80_06170 [Halobacteriota archaeon]|nr:hypothetical protein [Halobacteriota archaeon]